MTSRNQTSEALNDPGPPTQPAGPDEQVSQHGKRAVLVAAILGGLVVGGLLVDALRGPSKAATPPPAPEAKTAVPQDPFVDFEAKQKLEAARLESERQKKLAAKQREEAQQQREAQAEAGPQPVATVRSAEQEAREAARLEDLKRSLSALHSQSMVVENSRAKNSGVSGAVAGAVTSTANSLTGGATRSAAAPAADGSRGAESVMTKLRQAIDRVRGGYARDLSGAEAAQAVVGQSATARRERGEPAQREGEYLVPVGTVMAAVLDMEINSDWEGRWRAMITRDVYDLAQDVILIPKGTRVLGTSARPRPVNEAINERMALVAQWLVLPNGARIDLTRSSMLDSAGVAAIEGDVNRHFLATLGGVVAYGVIGGWGAAQAAKASRDDLGAASIYGLSTGRSAGAEIAQGLSDIGKRVASRYLNLVPTITVKPGTSMNIFLDDEMYLNAWAPIDEFAPAVQQPQPQNQSMRAAARN